MIVCVCEWAWGGGGYGWGLDAPAPPFATILWPRVTCIWWCSKDMLFILFPFKLCSDWWRDSDREQECGEPDTESEIIMIRTTRGCRLMFSFGWACRISHKWTSEWQSWLCCVFIDFVDLSCCETPWNDDSARNNHIHNLHDKQALINKLDSLLERVKTVFIHALIIGRIKEQLKSVIIGKSFKRTEIISNLEKTFQFIQEKYKVWTVIFEQKKSQTWTIGLRSFVCDLKWQKFQCCICKLFVSAKIKPKKQQNSDLFDLIVKA